jgi:hypothetical protein
VGMRLTESGIRRFSPLPHVGYEKPEADKHVEFLEAVLSDAGSTPAASTNLRANVRRRLPTVAFGEGGLTQSVKRYGWQANLTLTEFAPRISRRLRDFSTGLGSRLEQM